MYFITPNYSVGFNAKSGSSTLARAIIAAFHPKQEHTIQTAAYPTDVGPDDAQVQWLCPKEKEASKSVILVVREPVSRFLTAMAQMKLTEVNTVLDSLEQNKESQLSRRYRKLCDDVHFRHQHQLILNGGTAFRLEDLDLAATIIGLSLPLPKINMARGEKPVITSEQESRVLSYYSVDKNLYDSLVVGESTVVRPISPPKSDTPQELVLPQKLVPQQISARQIRLWLLQNGISLAAIDATIEKIPDAITRDSVKVEWEYAPYVERTHTWLATIAISLGLTESQIDNIFYEAAQL